MRRALLCIPRLLSARDDPLADAAGPALRRLLARAVRSVRAGASAEALLCDLYGVIPAPDWPIGALSLLGEGVDPGDGEWLRADPVHLRPEQSALILLSARHLNLSREESDALIAALNQHFAPESLQFQAHEPTRWHVRLPRRMDLSTCPLSVADGRSIDPLLPSGPDAITLHRWANEAQMLLHEHPVNLARETRGEAPINSLWWWGAGHLPAPGTSAHVAGWGDDSLLAGLCRWCGIACHPTPKDAADWLRQAGAGSHVLLLSGRPEQLDKHWFAPLLDALRHRELTNVTLITLFDGRALRFDLTAGDLWKFWRRPADLTRAANA